LHNLVNLLIEKKLYNEALVFSGKILELDSHNVIALVNTGIILVELGRVRNSEIIFKEALRFDPKSIEAMRNLGSLYGNIGNFDKALKLWKKALEIKPDDEGIKQNIKRLKAIRGY
jgi:tetratricopeptide (TPR) repeat protein